MQKGDGQPRTEDSLSRIVCYNAKPDEDAEAVADFVEAMIRNEVPLTGHGTHPARPAKAEDFMILTYAKKEANLYAKKLRARNIPVLLSGKELFSKTVPIARAVCFLRYLLEPEDPLWILSVLHRCYGVAYQDIRRRQKRAGVKKLNALFRRTDETRSETLLDALAAALLAEQPRDDKLCALCAALEELRRLRRFTQTLPAMTVLEQLFENVGCLWPDCGETLTRRVDYARVQQFLSELRSERERSFTDLARRALELADDAGKSDDTAASGDKGDTAETADTGTDQNGESKTSVGSGMGDAPNAPPYTTVDFAACASELLSAADMLSVSELYLVTPSRLDKAAHAVSPRPLKKDQDNTEDRTDDDEGALSVAPPDAAESGEADETASNDAVSDHVDGVLTAQRGKYWGTIVHRIMELAVSRGAFTPERIAVFARQAAYEALSDEVLSPKDREYLCCVNVADGEPLIAAVAAAAAQAAAFLSDDGAPLRRLAGSGRCYTELLFFLRAADRSDPLHAHISAHLKDKTAQDKILDVNGVIDLAIRKPDGEWIVVDYKTDSVRKGEREDAYRSRLEEYTPQIQSYCKVLEALQGGRVTAAYLCSVPLGGELIELEINGSDTPTALKRAPAPAPAAPSAPSLPAQAGAAVSHHVAELFTGRKFSSTLDNVTGATGFVLRRNGQVVPLTDKHGKTRESFKMCRDFSLGISDWVRTNWPGADASVDFTNAGSVVVLRRTLKMLKGAVPDSVWDSLEISWKK